MRTHDGSDGNASTGSGGADWALLPAWLSERLDAGPGRFGVLLATGHVLVVDAVRHVRQAGGHLWLDVEILIPFKKEGFPWGHFPLVKRSADERATCTLNAAHVVAVVEVDTWEVPPLVPSDE